MVRRQIGPQGKSQAMAQLLAASLNAPIDGSPLALVTNLNDEWYFMWLEVERETSNDWKRSVTQLRLTHPSNAVSFIFDAGDCDN